MNVKMLLDLYSACHPAYFTSKGQPKDIFKTAAHLRAMRQYIATPTICTSV